MALEFQSKARNLASLKNTLKSAKILPLVISSLEEVRQNEKKLLQEIQKLKAKKLIIRSSSTSEDSKENSNAGAFLSLANINANDTKELLNALLKVGQSMPSSKDEILIQAQLENITMCGVGFSVDKDNFAPYFCLQYDKSGSNSSITDGSAKESLSYFHYRQYFEFKDKATEQIISLIQELESLFECTFLDVEFAFAKHDKKEELFCLQVRPLVMQGKTNLFTALPKEALERFYKRFHSLNETLPRVLGKKSLFGVMPDWNPAEIIGLRPKRLAFSLYKEIITDTIWAYQRNAYGYRDLRSHPLIHSFLGIPYVDVRLSFNSFVPKKLDESIASKLVDFYLNKLSTNHEFHDKIEFDIVYSCYDFNTPNKLKELLQHGFNENEIKRLEFSLLELTNTIINPQSGLYRKDLEKSKNLENIFEKISTSKFSLIDKIYWLLEECKRYGTLPFCGVARAAFVAVQMLNSLVEIGFFTHKEKNDFLNSLKTISKNLSEDITKLNTKNKKEFLKKFGHLRAGTYNILSPRYDEDFNAYFDLHKSDSNQKKEKEFALSAAKKHLLQKLLKEHGLHIESKDFFAFLKEAIQARELVKFHFSKLLSQALVFIEELGKYYHINKTDMAHLDVRRILNLNSSLYSQSPKTIFLEDIAYNKKEYELTQAIKLPSLLSEASQIFAFTSHSILPNFITQKTIVADTAKENESDVKGKIVLIYAADPGYDYLFTKEIAGLITCYGGANSHMAIRASELALPAVIGVGEENFAKYLNAKKIRLECESEQIFCL